MDGNISRVACLLAGQKTIAASGNMVDTMITSRAYNGAEDLPSVMAFLRDVFRRTGTCQNWFPDHFENTIGNCGRAFREDDIRIWEDTDNASIPLKKRIIAVANPEDAPFDYYIQSDPTYSFLERRILEWIEANCLSKKKDSGKSEELRLHTAAGNVARESLLKDFGYRLEEKHALLKIRHLEMPIPWTDCPSGYEIRSVDGSSDHVQLAAAMRLVFGHGEWLNAELYERITHYSFYKQDLDLVAVAKDGTFASFCTFRMDPVSRITSLEPVGTHPSHRLRGLAKALVFEGLRRAMAYDPTLLYVEGANNIAANRLYDSVGYLEKLALCRWHKEI